MQTDTIASERFWASLLEMLPLATRKLPALYLSPFRRQSSTYVVWEGMSDALSGCSHSFRTWIHPRREYLYRISRRRLSLRNAACVHCATTLSSVSVCMSVWLHVGLYVYVCVCVRASVFIFWACTNPSLSTGNAFQMERSRPTRAISATTGTTSACEQCRHFPHVFWPRYLGDNSRYALVP